MPDFFNSWVRHHIVREGGYYASLQSLNPALQCGDANLISYGLVIVGRSMGYEPLIDIGFPEMLGIY